ncbi:MAG: GAF domain-containing protein [Balneolaceae bacterium]|nr:MAG: GAF domain-containing protein [Balneolaceae bacterium]
MAANQKYTDELKQREAELALINTVQQGLLAKKDMQEIYELIGDRLRDLFDAQVTGIYTFDHDSGQEHFQYLFEDGERLYPESRPLNHIRMWLINNADALLINDNADEKVEKITGDKHVAVPGTRLPKSLLFVPLIVDKRVTGCLSLQNLDREHAFSESDVQLLNTLANSISIALENARLFNETEQRNAELAVINTVQQGLVAEMDMQGIYELVGEKIRILFDAQVVIIATLNREDGVEHFQYFFENGERVYPAPRPYDMIRKRLISTQKLILIEEDSAQAVENLTGKTAVAVPGTKWPKSLLFVPLKVGDTVPGYVSLQNLDREFAFSSSDVRMLSTLANSMSVALENARLFNETEQRNAELAVINSVQQGLVAEMDMQGIYELVGDRVRELFDAQVVGINTIDIEKNMEYFHYFYEDGGRIYPGARPLDKVRQRLVETRKLIFINEDFIARMEKITGSPIKAIPGTVMPKSAVFVPMVVGDTVRGYVSLQNLDREHAFSESDVRLLGTLANSMSVALENARLFNETTRLLAITEQRATEMQTVNRISQALVSQLEFDALIQLVGELMIDTFKADIVYVAMYDEKSNMIHFPYEYGDKNESRTFGDGFTERIITNNEPLLINKDVAEIRAQLKAKQIGRVMSSFLGVPVQIGKKPIGVISVQSTEEENRFNENDMRLLNTIAASVSVAMQNADAYQKMRSALNDLKAAQEQLVQQEKLASLGQLTAGIAHEIKNPLNFVNNFSDVSLEMIDEALEEIRQIGENKHAAETAVILADIQANLKKIHEHGTRADSIVKSMLQHSRGGSGKLEPTDVNATLKEFVNLAFHGMRASTKSINVDIRFELDEKAGNVPLIPEDFSRVILNLCNNSFDAMRDKLSALNGAGKPGAAEPYRAELTIRTLRNNDSLTIEFKDNGPGIPGDIKDKILQPFFTTKKGTDGTGLGLSITNDIIKAHGGTLDIESEFGKYTTFKIHLT